MWILRRTAGYWSVKCNVLSLVREGLQRSPEHGFLHLTIIQATVYVCMGWWGILPPIRSIHAFVLRNTPESRRRKVGTCANSILNGTIRLARVGVHATMVVYYTVSGGHFHAYLSHYQTDLMAENLIAKPSMIVHRRDVKKLHFCMREDDNTRRSH